MSAGVKCGTHNLNLRFLTPEYGTDRLSRNIGKTLPLLAA